MLLRTKATQVSLELLRTYRSALDQVYEETRKSAYADAVVDVAILAAGWPLGNAATSALRGEIKTQITNNLIKGGFKSVEQALLKDPSLNGLQDSLTAQDRAQDLLVEQLKQAFGDVAGETVGGVIDLVKLKNSVAEGRKRLDVLRAQLRSTDDQIIRLQTRRTEQIDILDNAQRARSLCEDRVAKNLPPDSNNLFWRSVVD